MVSEILEAMMDYATRLNNFRSLLQKAACEAFLIEQPTNLFYLTGLELSAGALVVSQHAACLIVDGRYFQSASLQNLFPTILLEKNSLRDWLMDCSIHSLGFDTQETTYERFIQLQQLADKIHSSTYSFEVVPTSPLVQQLRLLKDQKEIQELRKAAVLGYQGYEMVRSLLKENVTEAELAFELEFFWKKQGAKRLAFDPIIAFGANSSMPHYHTNHTRLYSNTSVLIDIGVVLAQYHSDMTRVEFVGTPDSAIQKIYPIVEEAKSKALAYCRPGTLIGELDGVARSYISSQKYGEFFTHSLGHGVGLEIHEAPFIKSEGPYAAVPLAEGMVITIEPGIYLPGIGGVRLEDTIVITEQGYENLTVSNASAK